MKWILYGLAAAGGFLIVGTAGALDCDNITLAQGVGQYLAGAGCIIPGVVFKGLRSID